MFAVKLRKTIQSYLWNVIAFQGKSQKDARQLSSKQQLYGNFICGF